MVRGETDVVLGEIITVGGEVSQSQTANTAPRFSHALLIRARDVLRGRLLLGELSALAFHAFILLF